MKNRVAMSIKNPNIVPGPPSSLDPDAVSATTIGRQLDRGSAPFDDGSITGGDVDANIVDAATVGDEAPGGDNPTPDQDIVDEIGRALGIEYQDSQELRGGAELEERDRHRWELDPASAEDFEDRARNDE
jgi:hypothetical protein